MNRFLRILIGITALIHVPFVIGALEGLRRAGAPDAVRWGVTGVAAAIGVGLFVGRARKGMYDVRRSRAFVLLVDIPYFTHWCACLFTLLPSLVAGLVMAFVGWQPGFFLWTYLVGVAFAAYGILVRRRVFVTRDVEIPVEGLDPKLDGFRIAHLSDLHIGTMTPESWGARWAEAANARACDVAVVTGDMVSSGTEFYDDIARVVGRLTAKDGVFVSMGNHDYFGDGEPLIERLRKTGASVLRNEGRVIERDGARLYLAAIDDTWTKRDDMAKALAARPDGAAAVLLAHDPERFPDAAEREVDVVLSGHTHGGQVAVPFLARRFSLSKIAHTYTLGLYKKGRSTLYVHPGLGTTGPPVRFGVAPAVVIVTLRAV